MKNKKRMQDNKTEQWVVTLVHHWQMTHQNSITNHTLITSDDNNKIDKPKNQCRWGLQLVRSFLIYYTLDICSQKCTKNLSNKSFLSLAILCTFSALNRTQIYSVHICTRTCKNLDKTLMQETCTSSGTSFWVWIGVSVSLKVRKQ